MTTTKLLVWPPTPMQKWVGAGVGVLIATIVLWLWVSANERRARDLAIAAERERAAAVLAEADKKRVAEKQAEREQTAKLIEANIQLVQRFEQTIATSNARAAQARAAALAPKPVEQVIKEAVEQLGVTPRAEPDNRVSITKEELQSFLALKIEVDRLTRNDASREEQMRLLEDTNRRLLDQQKGYEESLKSKDLVIAAKQEALDAYKKVAKKSRFRTVIETTGKVGLGIAAGYLGARIAR